ncbi:YD repeat-containing protein [Tenacibaculum discolor]|nr:YD repeat-containing protein [Tenacibaculum discolor]
MSSVVMMLFCVWGYTQELPNIIPPSPTSYELGKYGQIPIGMFTGTANVNIPFFEYKTKNLSLPISISYNSNGIKVDQITSSVGLGWSLNAGGAITRIIRGLPDSYYDYAMYDVPPDVTNSNNLQFLYNAAEKAIDTEPDIYMFNFMGQSGQLIFDKNKKFYTTTISSLDVKYNSESNEFEIIDSKGVKYFFSDKEYSQSRSEKVGGDLSSYTPRGVTAWYLSKIMHPLGDEIEFIYENKSYHYTQGISENYSIIDETIDLGCLSNGVSCPDPRVYNTFHQLFSSQALNLVEIKAKSPSYGKVNFDFNFQHPEISGYMLLSSFRVLDASNKEIKKFDLVYDVTSNSRVFLTGINDINPKKKYYLEYISKEGLCKRNSFSQDYWGYYNGKINTHLVPKLSNSSFGNIGADRTPDWSYAKMGLLKRITYPTKGFSEFVYEPNSCFGNPETTFEKRYIPEVKLTPTSSVNESSITFITPKNLTTSNDYPIELNFTSILRPIQDQMQCNNQLSKAYLDIIDIQTNAKIYTFHISELNSSLTTEINLLPNKNYNIVISSDGCKGVRASLSYYIENTKAGENKNVGGFRIQEIITNSDSKKESTFYYYSKLDSLNVSSGDNTYEGYYISKSKSRLGCSIGCSSTDCIYKILNSSSITPLFNTGNNTTFYKYVTVSKGSLDFKYGAEQYEYIINKDIPAKYILGEFTFLRNNKWTNVGWNHGLVKQKKVLKKDSKGSFITLKENTYNYTLDKRLGKKMNSYIVNKLYEPTCLHGDARDLEQFEVIYYTVNAYWHYLSSSEGKIFNHKGENPIIIKTNYFYDNPSHLQQTRVETTNSQGEVLKTETKYAHDVNDQRLIDEHRIAEPLEVKRYKKNTLLSWQKTVYDSIHNPSNLYLPSKVQTSKGSQALEDRVVYHKYDDKGNPVEVSKADGTHIVYIWGYNETQPIAKIENAKLSDISLATISSLQSLSNQDNDTCKDSESCNEKSLRTALNNLRSLPSLTNAQIKTFTYDPLIGLTSITDPRGQTIYYQYDEFNRLEFIKDADENLLKEYKYHYKTNGL